MPDVTNKDVVQITKNSDLFPFVFFEIQLACMT